MTITAAQIIDEAIELLTPRGAWTQGEYARDADGHGTEYVPDAGKSEPVSFCLAGSLYRAGYLHPEVLNDAVARARLYDSIRAVEKVLGGNIPAFNDTKGRRKGQVIAKLRKARELVSA